MTVAEGTLSLPVVELSRRLEAGELHSVELTEAYLARIDRVAPKLNCFVTVTAERARDDARRADTERASGRRGPLLGIPYAAKDAIDTAGIPTTWGTRALLSRLPAHDADVIAKLREAGAVLLGKTSLTELCAAFSDEPESTHNGPCRNPWDVTRWTGGSSGGSAAAVAADLCPFALGTETAGSIEQPSSWCGVSGLRPTYDLVSRRGVMPLSWTLDKVGPICRDARDLRLILPAIAAGKVTLDQPVQPLRIGIVDQLAEPVQDPADASLWSAAKDELRAAGFALEPITLPDLPNEATMAAIIETDIFVAFEDFIRAGHVDKLYMRRPWREALQEHRDLAITGEDYVRAQRVRAAIQRAYQQLFTRVDAIVGFGLQRLPLVIGAQPAKLAKDGARRQLRDDGNLAGLPGLTLPIGFTANKLPRSLHAIAAPFEEHKLLALAERYQARTQFHAQRPTL